MGEILTHPAVGTIGTHQIFAGYLSATTKRCDDLPIAFLYGCQGIVGECSPTFLVLRQQLCVELTALDDAQLTDVLQVEHLSAVKQQFYTLHAVIVVSERGQQATKQRIGTGCQSTTTYLVARKDGTVNQHAVDIPLTQQQAAGASCWSGTNYQNSYFVHIKVYCLRFTVYGLQLKLGQ